MGTPAEQFPNEAIEVNAHLQNFNVHKSKMEQRIFKYGYIVLICLYFIDLGQIVTFYFLHPRMNFKYDATFTSNLLLIVVGMCLIMIPFNIWHQHMPRTLHYLVVKDRIFVRRGDIYMKYLSWLEKYHVTLRSPHRYWVIGPLFFLTACYYGYVLFFAIRDDIAPRVKDTIFVFSYIAHLALVAIILFESMFCISVVVWIVFISGRYIGRLTKEFEFNIEPLHPDKCGGFRILGNFCFGLASPVFIGSLFFIGYIFVALRSPSGKFDALTVGFVLLIILFCAIPTLVASFFLPLWSIHTKMLEAGEVHDEVYTTHMRAWKVTIQNMLDINKIQEAKDAKEKMDLTQTLYIPYPQWPFNSTSKFLSTSFTLISSLLLGLLTGLQEPLVKAIIQMISHN